MLEWLFIASLPVTVKRVNPRIARGTVSVTASISTRAHGKAAARTNRGVQTVRRASSSKSVNVPGPDPKLVREISALFGRAKHLIFSKFERQFAAQGESVQTWRALSQLKQLGRVAQYELAQAMAQHPGGISRLLDEIERHGLVKRRRDVHDRRKIWVELTARGHCRYEALRPVATRVLYQVFAPLSNDDCRALSRLLSKIMEPRPASTRAD